MIPHVLGNTLNEDVRGLRAILIYILLQAKLAFSEMPESNCNWTLGLLNSCISIIKNQNKITGAYRSLKGTKGQGTHEEKTSQGRKPDMPEKQFVKQDLSKGKMLHVQNFEDRRFNPIQGLKPIYAFSTQI